MNNRKREGPTQQKNVELSSGAGGVGHNGAPHRDDIGVEGTFKAERVPPPA